MSAALLGLVCPGDVCPGCPECWPARRGKLKALAAVLPAVVPSPPPRVRRAVRRLNGLAALALLKDLAYALEYAAALAPTEEDRQFLFVEASRARDLLRQTP